MTIFKRAVVDTEPLFSVALLKYARKLEERAARAIVERSRISAYLRKPARQDAIIQLFDGIDVILTTSHVIGELQGLQREKDRTQREFWLFAMDWLRSKGLDEQLLQLLELDLKPTGRRAICEIGPTDAGLLELAFREGTVLLTEDENSLARLGWEQGIDCKLVHTLLDTEFA